ncbi:hypothetical protein ABVK25_003768 [Lepraria finkii]|uniref:F-box domain-containing protein n=1 Tax=Lepraria finkii TaxID=1340010 RepID=A0ABR4BEG7_9LECA
MSSRNCSLLEKLPSEIHLVVMQQLDEPRDLQNLTTAYPRSFGLLFWQHFAIIIGPILENAQFPEELSQYICAIIHAKKHPSDHINDLKLFWNHHFEGTEPRRMHSALLRSPDDTLEEIITITETVGFFTGLATILLLAKHPMSN